jgi:hypothetical protein
MKAFSIIWGALALGCLAAVISGETHHWVTTLGSATMCIAMWPAKKADHER